MQELGVGLALSSERRQFMRSLLWLRNACRFLVATVEEFDLGGWAYKVSFGPAHRKLQMRTRKRVLPLPFLPVALAWKESSKSERRRNLRSHLLLIAHSCEASVDLLLPTILVDFFHLTVLFRTNL